MTQTRSRLHGLVAFALTLALVVVAAVPAVTSGQDKARNTGKGKATATEPTPEPSPTPTPQPTPEPTPYPAFDPGTLTLRLDLFADGFNAPVFIADDGVPRQGCLYVVERGGIVKIIEASDNSTRLRPFLDISKRLEGIGPEQGLHSIAFHPDFAKNGRFFAHYTDADKTSVVAEFKGKPCGRANNKPKTLLVEKQEYINNNGGWIGFGPDDKLYIATGDGGGPAPGDPNGIGQSPSTRLGKILRVDVDTDDRFYGIPADNPYVKRGKNGKLQSRRGFEKATWAYGLRDPRRASFDRGSGDLWIGDVGQDRLEEINRIPADATKKNDAFNFGWSDVVGESTCYNLPDCDATQYDPPQHAYDKVSPHRGVTGGYVYRGELLPALEGVYLFSDVASGYIWGLDADAVIEGFEAPVHQLLDAPRGIVSFGEDDSGELYVVSLDGSIFRLDLLDT